MPPDSPKPASVKGLGPRATGTPDGLRFAVYGPGRVGTSLAAWCLAVGARLEAVVSRSGGLDDLPDELAAGNPRVLRPDAVGDLATLRPRLDLLLLTVSDDALEECAQHVAETFAEAFAEHPADRPGNADTGPIVLHVAGCRDASVLAPVAATGAAVGSLHPLRAFTGFEPRPDPRTVYAVDGSAPALRLARRLVDAWSGRAVELAGERRVAYHLAASLAAGGVTTVVAAVGELMRHADLPADARDAVLAGYLALLHGAVDAAEAHAAQHGLEALAEAITGPAARGDRSTLARHREALERFAPDLLPTVDALWNETARQVALADRGESAGEPGDSR